MKKVFIFFIAVLIVSVSCKEDEEAPVLPFEEQLVIDLEIIDNYLVANNIQDVLQDCYTIPEPGSPCEGHVSYNMYNDGEGIFINELDIEFVASYTGRLMDTGVEFDSNDSAVFSLRYLIPGWQIVLLDRREGDSLTMYIPSGYAYNSKGKGDDIPANANLIFDIKILQVN